MNDYGKDGGGVFPREGRGGEDRRDASSSARMERARKLLADPDWPDIGACRVLAARLLDNGALAQ
jgi:hypothetical protein